MASIIEMPKLSDTMVTGRIVSWLKEEGDEIKSGTAIAEVETDKATMELECFDDGTLLKVLAQVDSDVPVGGPIAIIGQKGEDVSGLMKEAEGKSAAAPAEPAQKKSTEAPAQGNGQEEAESKSEAAPAEPAQKESTEAPAQGNRQEEAEEQLAIEEKREKPKTEEQPKVATFAEATAPKTAPESDSGRMRVSPVAQRMAAEHNVDLRNIKGSGPSGRIVKRDVESFLEENGGQPTPPGEPAAAFSGAEYEDIALSSIRATIARRLPQSLGPVPHFFVEAEVDAEPLMRAKDELKALAGEDVKVTVTDLLIKACAVALRKNPAVNSQFQGDTVRRFNICNIGIAVAGQGTLLVPVIRNCEVKPITLIAQERAALADRARQGKLTAEQMSNGTFTISNMGMMGITRFSAIINPPQSAILAVGAARDEAVVKNGAIVPGKRMSITMSCDHRAFDGAEGAKFMADLKQILENPLSLCL